MRILIAVRGYLHINKPARVYWRLGSTRGGITYVLDLGTYPGVATGVMKLKTRLIFQHNTERQWR